ncbi:histidine kinase [Caulobacter segnis]
MKDLDAGPRAGLAKPAAVLTLGVWGLDALLFGLPSLAAGKPQPAGVTLAYALAAALGLALSIVVHRRAARIAGEGGAFGFSALLPTVLLAGVAVAVVDMVVGGQIRILIDGTHPTARIIAARAISQFMMAAWMFALLGALYLMMFAPRVAQERERQLADARAQALAAEAQASAARLAALRYQLNPHFLFNTLNAVSASVITGRNDEAESMLARPGRFAA